MRSVRLLLLVLATSLGLASLAFGEGPVPGIPFIDQAGAFQAPTGEVSVVVFGHFPTEPAGACWRADPVSQSPPTLRIEPVGCADTLNLIRHDWGWRFSLGVLAAGHHLVQITVLHQETPGAVDPTVYQGYFAFDLPRDSIPSRLPYVEEVRIEPAYVRNAIRPICAGDSIRVTVLGNFPSPCYSLEKVEVLDLAMTPVPGPPLIGLTVDRGSCKDFCPGVLEPWSASVVLPPLPAGRYRQILNMIETDCALPDSVVAQHSASVPFAVSGECAPSGACLWPGFAHPNGPGACDAFVSPGKPARATFTLGTTVALAGLQGRFTVDPAKLKVVAIEPVGPAAGMHLNWVPTENGARFTLFAERGAPIPACGDDVLDPLCAPSPVLAVSVAALDAPAPGEAWLNVAELLGSDAVGNAVEPCAIRIENDFSRIAWWGAKICPEPGCDFNTDGRTDVRDLVLMVHCVNDSTTCPNPAFDCNRDSTRSIEDVICCAMHMLREGRICPECPPDTTRPAPHVRAAIGAPVTSEAGVEIPVTLIGAEFLGGAVLEFDFPSARYDVDVSLGGSQTWLELDEVRDGKLAVGLVRTSPIMTLDVDQRLNLTLRFTLKPGQRAGGDLAYAHGEFSGMDGTLLEVDLGSLRQTLGAESMLSLSEPRPNPSAGETRFSLTLDRAADVELSVYDLNGRHIASMHRGPLGAGLHEFQWQGRADHGGAAANGIYFYRATGGGASVTRKLVLLRGR